jgi:hypothetical protein
MEYQSNNKMYGVVQGVSYGQQERVDELNDRISSRHFPDMPLQPNYDPRPVPTKYSLFPIVDRKKPVKEVALPYPSYSTNYFNPGTAKGPTSGFFSNVDTETILRNQTFALQHTDQSVYVPSSSSDLYKVDIVSKPVEQPYPLLFSRFAFDHKVHPNNESGNIGNETFFNHTRTQLRNM